MDQLSQDCLDQVRLVAKVVAKVNNADIKVVTQENGKKVEKVHSSEYEVANWECPSEFMTHHTHAPCCFFSGECSAREKSNGGLSNFKCAQSRCDTHGGEWVLKDPDGLELSGGGHLCCPAKKDGVRTWIDGELVEFKGSQEADSWYSSIVYFLLLVSAAAIFWQRNVIKERISVFGDVSTVHTPLNTIELTTFITGLFSAVKKRDFDFVKSPQPCESGKSGSFDASSGVYGGL
jgi:hypothetical protein